MDLLISINYSHIEKIENNIKKYELRKRIYRRKIKYIYVHSSGKYKNIVGRFIPLEIINNYPDTIWNKLNSFLGITEKEFKNYTSNNNTIYAIKIGSYEKPKKTIELKKIFNKYNAPQMYKYLTQDESNLLRRYF